MYGILLTGDNPGHLHYPHANNEGNTCTQQEKLQESMKNQKNNDHFGAELPYQKLNLQVLRPSIPMHKNNVHNKEQKEVRILIEKRSKNTQSMEVNKIIADTIQSVVKLLQTWKNENIIQGIYPTEHTNTLLCNMSEFKDLDKWLTPPRAIQIRKNTKIEMIFAIHTSYSAYQLYQNQKEIFDNENIRITTKRTNMLYTKRIGFILGPYLKLASVTEYEKEMNKMLELQEGNIEVKKEFIYESNAKTKALVIYALENKAKELDYKLYSAENKHLQYV